MRSDDGPTQRDEYAATRGRKAIYGLAFALIGLAVMFYLPSAQEWVRLASGFVLILLGGVLIDPSAVRYWVEIVKELRPLAGRKP